MSRYSEVKPRSAQHPFPYCAETRELTGLVANNFNGDNLLECDQKILQEMGIKKIGDRVRIFVAIKQLRNKAISNRKLRNMVSCLAVILWNCGLYAV